MKRKVKQKERGWAGHFCNAAYCRFRRNTLLEAGDTRIVVSTIGAYNPSGKKVAPIGPGRYYETMAFHARLVATGDSSVPRFPGYWDADVSREVEFDADWALPNDSFGADWLANGMHERVVAELKQKLAAGVAL